MWTELFFMQSSDNFDEQKAECCPEKKSSI